MSTETFLPRSFVEGGKGLQGSSSLPGGKRALGWGGEGWAEAAWARPGDVRGERLSCSFWNKQFFNLMS